MLYEWLIDEYFITWISTISDFIRFALIGLVIGGIGISIILAKVVDK